MKYSMSNIAWDKEQNKAVYTLMQNYGFTGLEIAPTKIFSNLPYSKVSEASKWSNTINNKYGLSISSIQSIWYGRTEQLFGTDIERKILYDYTMKSIDFAVAVGAKNLVFGCPKNRQIPDGAEELIAVRFFKELGDYAAEKGTCIGMEANPEIYGTNFINTTGEAISFVRQVSSDGFKLNLDIGTMIQNKESVAVLQGSAELINHVHISEPFLKKIEKRDLHKELFDFLRTEKYNGFVSVEMGLHEQIRDIEDVMKYVKEI